MWISVGASVNLIVELCTLKLSKYRRRVTFLGKLALTRPSLKYAADMLALNYPYGFVQQENSNKIVRNTQNTAAVVRNHKRIINSCMMSNAQSHTDIKSNSTRR